MLIMVHVLPVFLESLIQKIARWLMNKLIGEFHAWFSKYAQAAYFDKFSRLIFKGIKENVLRLLCINDVEWKV